MEEIQKKMEGQVQLWKHIKGFIDSAALRCAVQIGLADIIHKHGEPVTIDQIAAALSIPSLNKDSLYRILRYLVHLNLFYCIDDDDDGEMKYALTPASELLVRGQDKSLASFVSFILRPDSVQMMQYMKASLEGSDTPLQRFLGTEHEKEKFKWAEESPESNEEYMEVMRGNTSIVIGEIVSRFRESGAFDEAGTLVDVGGNTGQVAEAIASAFPHLKCSVLELPHVVEAVAVPPAMISFVKGDMFESVPKADVVFMKSVLHDWNDEDCIRILKKCKEAIPSEGGKVILVDIVLDTNSTDGLAGARLGMEMLMLAVGGKERTMDEWKKIIKNAGFSHYKIIPMKAMESIIELCP
ncbi:(RS)-norcoclaurine 6-O-methyltransferase-like [Magnolia sinica]|uniref:(RS)-norcoclaurine 6-O-methyltransferase-like n=1 Tax=Magnolia sinica TaxID=86752 RepID=UPI00265B0F12|nr:(RS)-norcoclaurine 6-O-methyltransferase-like [Magnolia sinica]